MLWLLNKIVNITDDYVAFRIYSKGRVTANYYLPVQRGILAPRSSTEFRFARLSRENQPETGEGKEFRVVRSTVVSKDTNISDVSEDLFDYPEVAAAAGIFVHEVKQPIFVVPPPGEQSLEVTKHSIPLVSPTGSNETKYEVSPPSQTTRAAMCTQIFDNSVIIVIIWSMSNFGLKICTILFHCLLID